jgi:tRNA nucleotidyltransferase (CCA-adding enzyme)
MNCELQPEEEGYSGSQTSEGAMTTTDNEMSGGEERRGVPSGKAVDRAGTATLDGQAIVARLRELAGGPELLAAAKQHSGGVELVGGAVRDIALDRVPRELDAIVISGVEQLASTLAARLEGQVTLHERFGTALVRGARADVDLARVRAESYAAPGALPDVRDGTPEEDLARRDFTVNAIAVALDPERRGQLRAAPGALEDLAARRLRVLHDASFTDDPTRILRLVRYAARLGFTVDPHTGELASTAIEGGALRSVSSERLGAELRLALAEPDPVAPLAELDRMGVFAAWESEVSFDEHLARTALRILPSDGSPRVLLAAALILEQAWRLSEEDTELEMRGFLHELELPTGEARRAFGAAVSATVVTEQIGGADTTADLLDLTLGMPVEALALAAATHDMEAGPNSYGRRVIEEWLRDRRHITLEINGEDLIAAGVPEGPEVGVRLEESYRLLIEERIEPGRDTELRAALEASI